MYSIAEISKKEKTPIKYIHHTKIKNIYAEAGHVYFSNVELGLLFA